MGVAATQMEKRGSQTEKRNANRQIAAERYLNKLKSSGEPLTPKNWQTDISVLTAKKDLGYKDMREQQKAVETLKKTAEKLEKEQPNQSRKKEGQEL